MAVASDNCSTPTVTYSDRSGSSNPNGCNPSITRTFVAVDACGNMASVNQIIVFG